MSYTVIQTIIVFQRIFRKCQPKCQILLSDTNYPGNVFCKTSVEENRIKEQN